MNLLASQTPEIQAAILAKLTEDQLESLQWSWEARARPEQLAPVGNWRTWLYLAGRGAGKTRSGSEWTRSEIKKGRGRGALVAPTASDARDVMVEGESGLLSVCHESDVSDSGEQLGRPVYEPSKRRVTWANGAMCTLYSAEEADRLRGPQHDFAWADELAAWKRARAAWDMLQFGLRLGGDPQQMVTTTPKPISLLVEILEDADTIVSRGSTMSNAANLAPSFLKAVQDKYGGTTLGRQELSGEMLTEAEGALWSRDMIEGARASVADVYRRIVVAVDPAVTSNSESAETGVVVVGLYDDETAHILEDVSAVMSPNSWAECAVDAYYRWNADRIVAEVNQGGDLVETVVRQVDKNVAYRAVRASRGKAARAEPVVALYEQGRVKHAGKFPDLEDQLVSWVPSSGMVSPDRLDALVWGVTDLLLSKTQPFLPPSSQRPGYH